jgi:hypothetical protein
MEKPMSDDEKSGRNRQGRVAQTPRPVAVESEGGKPLPKELTGSASETNDDLIALFKRDTAEHFADGFHGGSNGDPGSDLLKGTDSDPDAGDDVTVV